MDSQVSMVPKEDLDNLIFVAKNRVSLQDSDPRLQRAIAVTITYLFAYQSPYAILEAGPGMEPKDRERIMKRMEDLYSKYETFTLAIWISKESCPSLSIAKP